MRGTGARLIRLLSACRVLIADVTSPFTGRSKQSKGLIRVDFRVHPTPIKVGPS